MEMLCMFSVCDPTRRMLPVCSIGGLAAISRTRSSRLSNPLDLTLPKTCTSLSDPGLMWIYPEPVEMCIVTAPESDSVRSKVASEASAGSVPSARRSAHAEIQCFILVPHRFLAVRRAAVAVLKFHQDPPDR